MDAGSHRSGHVDLNGSTRCVHHSGSEIFVVGSLDLMLKKISLDLHFILRSLVPQTSV